MSVKTKLVEEFESEMEGLSEMELGSEDHKVTANVVFGLVDRINEIEKLEIEKQEKAKERELEAELKLKQMEEDRKSRRWRDGIAIGTLVLSVGFGIWSTRGTWVFDTMATSTTTNGRTTLGMGYPKSLRL